MSSNQTGVGSSKVGGAEAREPPFKRMHNFPPFLGQFSQKEYNTPENTRRKRGVVAERNKQQHDRMAVRKSKQ